MVHASPERQRVHHREHHGADPDTEGERRDDDQRLQRMVTETARGEPDVRVQLAPRAPAAHVARRFLLRFHPPELDSCGALGGLARQPSPLEVRGAQLDVGSELLVHLALVRRTAKEMADDGTKAIQTRRHRESGVARSAAVMPATTCSQLERSSRSCLRPSGVMR
jgi:hypothetical protein